MKVNVYNVCVIIGIKQHVNNKTISETLHELHLFS